jgi:hypothetical protein
MPPSSVNYYQYYPLTECHIDIVFSLSTADKRPHCSNPYDIIIEQSAMPNSICRPT